MSTFSYTILGSGSSANSYWFENTTWAFLVDNGYSLKEFKIRVKQAGLDPRKLRFVFLTHEHGDHLRGVSDVARWLGIPVVHHRDLPLDRVFRPPLPQFYSVEPGKSYDLQGCQLRPFGLHHDARHPLSIHVTWEGVTFTLITDTGCTTDEMLNMASRSQLLFLESNYCPTMLREGPYPWPLKNRISGSLGHLSNVQALEFLNTLGERFPDHRLQKVYLVHLSETNNHPEVVRKGLEEGLRHPIPWEVCPKSALIPGQPIVL